MVAIVRVRQAQRERESETVRQSIRSWEWYRENKTVIDRDSETDREKERDSETDIGRKRQTLGEIKWDRQLESETGRLYRSPHSAAFVLFSSKRITLTNQTAPLICHSLLTNQISLSISQHGWNKRLFLIYSALFIYVHRSHHNLYNSDYANTLNKYWSACSHGCLCVCVLVCYTLAKSTELLCKIRREKAALFPQSEHIP